jgi:hypothetical protein
MFEKNEAMPNGSSSAARRRTINRAKVGLERLTMNTFAEARKQRRQCFDVYKRSAEVHDAGSQRKLSIDNGIGQECFTTFLNARQPCLIDFINALLDGGQTNLRLQLRRYISKCRDAQLLRERLELWVPADERVEMLRQPHVLGDHADRADAADLPKCQPHFKRAETPRILRALIEIISGSFVKVIVGRTIRKCSK